MRGRRHKLNLPDNPAARFIVGGVGLIFAGIGIAVLIFLWSAPFGQFGSPPLFFRVFGSFIALAFVLIGGGQFVMTAFGGGPIGQTQQMVDALRDQGVEVDAAADAPRKAAYACPGCGAPLAAGADVSPHGDVKCSYCGQWFNVHSRQT